MAGRFGPRRVAPGASKRATWPVAARPAPRPACSPVSLAGGSSGSRDPPPAALRRGRTHGLAVRVAPRAAITASPEGCGASGYRARRLPLGSARRTAVDRRRRATPTAALGVRRRSRHRSGPRTTVRHRPPRYAAAGRRRPVRRALLAGTAAPGAHVRSARHRPRAPAPTPPVARCSAYRSIPSTATCAPAVASAAVPRTAGRAAYS